MYTELADYGLIWAVVLAGAGVVLVATMLLLMLAFKIPKASKFVGRTLLR